MVALWGVAATVGLDSTAIAFLGLGVLLTAGVLTLDDIAKEGDVLATFIWFAVLFTMSGQLNDLGFMGYVGRASGARAGRAVAGGCRRRAGGGLRGAALPVREPDRAPAGAFRRVPRRWRDARRAGGASRVPVAVRHQFFLGQHPAGLERKPAVRRERVSHAGRAVPAGRHHDRIQPGGVPAGRARRGCCFSIGNGSKEAGHVPDVSAVTRRGVLVGGPADCAGRRSTEAADRRGAGHRRHDCRRRRQRRAGRLRLGAGGRRATAGRGAPGPEAGDAARRADLEYRVAGHERRGVAEAGAPRQRARRHGRRRWHRHHARHRYDRGNRLLPQSGREVAESRW